MEQSGTNLSSWSGAPQPKRLVLDGAYVRLEPLDALSEAELDWLHSTNVDDADFGRRLRWLKRRRQT